MHALDLPCIAMVSVQVLMGLPDNLLVSVLRSSQMPLLKQLSRLPQVWHMAALHAACPRIAAHHSLQLRHMRGVFRKQDAEALGLLFASLSSLQHLDLRGNEIGEEGTRALSPYLANLLSLQHLDIPRNDTGAEGARALGPHLANLSSLQHLDIRANHMGAEVARSLWPHLANLLAPKH